MKLSKNKALFLLTVFVCFAIGFAIGAFPDRWQKIRGKPAGQMTLLTSSPTLIPPSALLQFEKATGIPVELKVIESFHLFRTEAKDADLLLAPLSWMSSFPEILVPLPNEEDLRQELSSDFQTMKLDLDFFLPVLWKTEQKDNQIHLLIWGFATPKSRAEVHSFLNYLLNSNPRLIDWAEFNKLHFTLQKTNNIEKFPDNQKAQTIREVPLSNLVIEKTNP